MSEFYAPDLSEHFSDGHRRYLEAKNKMREFAKKHAHVAATFKEVYGHSHDEQTLDEYQEPHDVRRMPPGKGSK